jgi:hypothetical protein
MIRNQIVSATLLFLGIASVQAESVNESSEQDFSEHIEVNIDHAIQTKKAFDFKSKKLAQHGIESSNHQLDATHSNSEDADNMDYIGDVDLSWGMTDMFKSVINLVKGSEVATEEETAKAEDSPFDNSWDCHQMTWCNRH